MKSSCVRTHFTQSMEKIMEQTLHWVEVGMSPTSTSIAVDYCDDYCRRHGTSDKLHLPTSLGCDRHPRWRMSAEIKEATTFCVNDLGMRVRPSSLIDYVHQVGVSTSGNMSWTTSRMPDKLKGNTVECGHGDWEIHFANIGTCMSTWHNSRTWFVSEVVKNVSIATMGLHHVDSTSFGMTIGAHISLYERIVSLVKKLFGMCCAWCCLEGIFVASCKHGATWAERVASLTAMHINDAGDDDDNGDNNDSIIISVCECRLWIQATCEASPDVGL